MSYIRLSKSLVLYTTVEDTPLKVTPSPEDAAVFACAWVGASVVVLVTVPSDDEELWLEVDPKLNTKPSGFELVVGAEELPRSDGDGAKEDDKDFDGVEPKLRIDPSGVELLDKIELESSISLDEFDPPEEEDELGLEGMTKIKPSGVELLTVIDEEQGFDPNVNMVPDDEEEEELEHEEKLADTLEDDDEEL